MNATPNTTSRIAWRCRALSAVAVLAGAFAVGGAPAHEPAGARAFAKNPSAQLYASPSQVRIVQEKLRARDHRPGAQGAWDQATIAAVRDYQQAQGLPATGQLDTSLLSALEIGDVLEGEESSGFLDGLLRADETESSRLSGRGAPLYVSPVHVAQIQHLLREQGYYSSEIDGAWGPQTARAANEFRKAHGLEATEGLDIALLRTLNRQGSAVPKHASQATQRAQGVPLHAGPAAVRALQRELAQKGHKAGSVDGVWGENTRQALREFQREHDLETTGTLTLPTLAALGIDVTSEGDRGDIAARTRGDDVADRERDPDALATTAPERD